MTESNETQKVRVEAKVEKAGERVGQAVEQVGQVVEQAGQKVGDVSRDIGGYIRAQREHAQVSLRELARTAGVSNPYLSQIERGLRKPSAEILQQIAKGLRISAEALYVRAGILDEKPASAVTDAVLADSTLTERQKQVLLDVYQSFRRENGDVPSTTTITAQHATEGVIIMAVSLPTAADVRKVRETARKSAVERVEIVRTPALAVLGAADYAVATVTKAVADARARAAAQREDAQARLNGAQKSIAELPQKLTADELKKTADELRAQAEKSYEEFAARGEQTLGRIRKQPQVKQALDTIENVTGKFDARVDALVDDAHDAAEKALSTVSTQTRSTGEKVAQAAQRFTGQASTTISKATKEASETVAEVGAKAAAEVSEAGSEVAKETRSTTRKAANRTAPAKSTTTAKAPVARTRRTTK